MKKNAKRKPYSKKAIKRTKRQQNNAFLTLLQQKQCFIILLSNRLFILLFHYNLPSHTIFALYIQAFGSGFSNGIPIVKYARVEFLMLIYCGGMAAFLRRKFGGSAINN